MITHKILRRNNKSNRLRVRKHPTYEWKVYTCIPLSHVREARVQLSPQTYVRSLASTTATEPIHSLRAPQSRSCGALGLGPSVQA